MLTSWHFLKYSKITTHLENDWRSQQCHEDVTCTGDNQLPEVIEQKTKTILCREGPNFCSFLPVEGFKTNISFRHWRSLPQWHCKDCNEPSVDGTGCWCPSPSHVQNRWFTLIELMMMFLWLASVNAWEGWDSFVISSTLGWMYAVCRWLVFQLVTMNIFCLGFSSTHHVLMATQGMYCGWWAGFKSWHVLLYS